MTQVCKNSNQFHIIVLQSATLARFDALMKETEKLGGKAIQQTGHFGACSQFPPLVTTPRRSLAHKCSVFQFFSMVQEFILKKKKPFLGYDNGSCRSLHYTALPQLCTNTKRAVHNLSRNLISSSLFACPPNRIVNLQSASKARAGKGKEKTPQKNHTVFANFQ